MPSHSGRVKLGIHIEKNYKVAIKIIGKPEESDDKSMSRLTKLEREITIMKLITHPNVLQLYDVYDSAKNLYVR
jgi:serine/threonine protein kinase